MDSNHWTAKKTINGLDHVFVGRQAELKSLKSEFRKTTDGGMGLLVLSGASGSGKTYLINHFANTHSRAAYIHIKIPNSQLVSTPSIFHLAEVLAAHLLTLEKSALDAVVQNLHNDLKNDVSILAAVSDNLAKLLTITKKRHDLDLGRLKFRIKNAICSLIDVAAQYLHPLFICIDDLQWSDQLSLDIIRKILMRKQPFNILLVLCFRDKTNPVRLSTVKEVIPSGHMHNLKPLDKDEIKTYIKSVLGSQIKDLDNLASLLFGWTSGSPFYIKQLLKIMLSEKFIQYQDNAWVLYAEKVNHFLVGKNIKQKIIEKISAQSRDDILDIIACFDGRISNAVLSSLIKDSDLSQRIKKLIGQGILISHESYGETVTMFSHDLILSYVLSHMDAAYKEDLHYQIAKKLFKTKAPDAQNKNDIIAFHLMRSGESDVCRDAGQWIQILYDYGLKEKHNASISAALQTFERCQHALGCIPDSPLSLSIHLEYAECLCLCGQDADGFGVINSVQKIYKDRSSVLAIKRKLLYIYHYQRNYQKTLQIGQSILRLLGLGGGKFRMLYDLLICRIYFDSKRIDRLSGFSNKSNARISILLDTLTVMNAGAAVFDESKTASIALSAALISTKTNVASEMLIGCVSYAYVLKTLWNDRDKAKRLTERVIELSHITPEAENKAMVYFIIGSFLTHWSLSLKDSDFYLQKSIEFGYISADFLFLGYAVSASLDARSFMGISPEVLSNYIGQCKDLYGDVLQYQSHYNLDEHLRHIHILKSGVSGSLSTKIELVYNTLTPFEKLTGDMLLLERLFLLDDLKVGYHRIKKIARNVHGTKGLISEIYIDFYSLLIRTGLHQTFRGIQRLSNKIIINRLLKRLEAVSQTNLKDFSAALMIARAEYNCAIKRAKQNQYYDAIKHSEASGNPKFLIIANLLAARRHSFNPDISQHYASESAALCRSWGADYIAEFIESQYHITDKSNQNTPGISVEAKDLKKAISRISDHNRIKSPSEAVSLFLSAVIDIQVFDYCGVILQKNNHLYLINYIKKGERLIQDRSAVNVSNALLPHKLIRYTARTEAQTYYNPNDARSPFSDDQHMKRNPDTYMLCMPMFNCNVFSGMVYLEQKNDEMKDADILWVNCLIPALVSSLNEIREINIKELFSPAQKKALLSKREMDIIKFLAFGHSNEDIAKELCLSIGTVKKHISSILFKLNVNNRTKAVLKAKELRII